MKSIYNTFLDKINQLNYFGDKTNIHGVRHVFSLSHIPLYKRLFWIVILSASCLSASMILRPLLDLYSGDAVSYLMDTNYLNFKTPFPAVTLCPNKEGDRIKKYIAKHGLPKTLTSFYTDVAIWNLKYCKSWCTGSSCILNVTCVDNFIDAVQELRAPCTDVLTHCWFDGKYFPCCERFHPVETEYGMCYAFNSRLTGNVTMLNNARRSDLPSLIFSAKEEVAIRVHAPDDMVSVGMENIMGKAVSIPLISNFELILKAELTTSDKSVKPMAPHARNCLFENERPSYAKYWNFKIYSFNTCMLYCRAISQFEFCNCTHHLMPALSDPFGADCDCPMSCEEVLYKVIHKFHTYENKPYPPELEARGSRGRIYLSELPTLRVRRVAIRHMLGFVVDIGGVLGVFFGASLLSILEIIYLLFIRRSV